MLSPIDKGATVYLYAYMYMHVNAHLPPLGRQQRPFIKSGMTMVLKDKIGRA